MTQKEARARAKRLVGRMTARERLGQLCLDAPAIPRLRVPACRWRNAALPGLAHTGRATVFPQETGLAATFDPRLLEEIGAAVGMEARARYNALARHGGGDLPREIPVFTVNAEETRRLRGDGAGESFGEDPALASRLSTALARGLQGQGKTMLAAACAGFPAPCPDGGDPKDAAGTLSPALKAMVREAEPAAAMGSGGWEKALPVLREEWGFEGVFFAGDLAEDSEDAERAARAVNAGCDLLPAGGALTEAWERGLLPEEAVTAACVRLFTLRFRLGLFGKTGFDNIPYDQVESPEHLDLARRASGESAVLLKNDGVLPLDRAAVRTLSVIGPCADSRRALLGRKGGSASRYITVQEGLQDYLYGSGIRILTSEGCASCGSSQRLLEEGLAEAAAVARMSDAVILVLGFDGAGEGETLSIPGEQLRLMEMVAGAGKPTALCLMAGGGVDLEAAREHCGAILDIWHPGSMGGRAVAELLFGEQSPSGKLPLTFRRAGGPDGGGGARLTGRERIDAEKPVQFPFGFGLTYGNVIIRSARFKGDRERGYFLEADIGNRGPRDTGEVLQVYIRRLEPPSAALKPALCAFKRVWLPVWGHGTVEIPLPDLAFTALDGEGRRAGGGRFELYLGTSQPDEMSRALTGKAPLRMEIEI